MKLNDGAVKIAAAIKKNKYVLAVVILGLVLLLLPRASGKASAQGESPVLSEEAYTLAELERRMAEALSEIEGAGKVKVLLTLKTGAERIVALDETEKDGGEDRSSETVIVSSGSSLEEPVVLKILYPEYLGALIVAQGAGSSGVRLALTEAAMSLTGLGADKITVSKMKA